MEKIKTWAQSNKERLVHFLVLVVITVICTVFLDFGNIGGEANFIHYLMAGYLVFALFIPVFFILLFGSLIDALPYVGYIIFLILTTITLWHISGMFVSIKSKKIKPKHKPKQFVLSLIPFIIIFLILAFIISQMGILAKPAIYLYPEEDSFVDVKLNINGKITVTKPPYGDGWNVFATKEGTINGGYDYLFWEAIPYNLGMRSDLPSEGWVVKYEDLESWFDVNLIKLGLNEKEKGQFMEYWLKKLPESDYYEIKLLSDEFMAENMDLIVSPQPDTVIRLNFYFKPHNEKIDLVEPEIKPPQRTGFVVVEWGGILDDGLF
ncbi:MAG: hypothetical protein MSIBF_01125 [Candidatus Altiarchaeales archaeon IMC4]|nr:MAG: hypothetical protein MSIBF_01125 [Candidatus Altiarchaeales archaeon IMC4]